MSDDRVLVIARGLSLRRTLCAAHCARSQAVLLARLLVGRTATCRSHQDGTS